MKWISGARWLRIASSRPVWGAWIEIFVPDTGQPPAWSRPVWGAWIEIYARLSAVCRHQSRPVWGAWIEIVVRVLRFELKAVAPRMGRVD